VEGFSLGGIIEEAVIVDTAGSAVLEHLLQLADNSLPYLDVVNLKETISITCWIYGGCLNVKLITRMFFPYKNANFPSRPLQQM
jgi:hypothetical protein